MKRIIICFVLMIATFGCVSYKKKLHEKEYIGSIWKLNTPTTTAKVFSMDTISLTSCNFCDLENPLNKNPTFIFNRRKLRDNDKTVSLSNKQDFLFCLSPTIDTMWTNYSNDLSGKWKIQHSKKGTQLVLKQLKEKGNINLGNKSEIIFTVVFLDKNKMVLVKL